MRFIPLLLVFSLFAQDDVGAPAKSGTTGSIGTVTQARTTYISDLEIEGEFIPVESIQIETQFIF